MAWNFGVFASQVEYELTPADLQGVTEPRQLSMFSKSDIRENLVSTIDPLSP